MPSTTLPDRCIQRGVPDRLHIEMCVAELQRNHPSSFVVQAGDFNQLSDSDIIERTNLLQSVRQRTRGTGIHLNDRIYVSYSHYSAVRIQ